MCDLTIYTEYLYVCLTDDKILETCHKLVNTMANAYVNNSEDPCIVAPNFAQASIAYILLRICKNLVDVHFIFNVRACMAICNLNV